MATWKKVIVSGSDASLNSLQVVNAVTASIFSGSSFTGSLQGTASYVSASSVYGPYGFSSVVSASNAVTAAYALAAAAPNALTNGEGITTFSYNGGSAGITVSISGAADLTDGRHIKWDNTANKVANSLIYDDGTNVQITGSSIIVSGASTAFVVTGSVRSSGGFTGSLFGTASYVTSSNVFGPNGANSIATASYALTASYLNNLFQNLQITGSSIIISGASTVFSVTGSISSTGGFTGSLLGTASYVTSSNVFGPNGSNSILTSSYAVTASYAATGSTLLNSVTPGLGLSGSAFNGSSAQTFYVSGAAQLVNNYVTKWVNGSGFNTASITDNGTLITLGTATIGVSIPGNLTVAGTASFTNTDSLFVADKFIALSSGSTTIGDSGLVVVTSTNAGNMSGSAFYLESTTDASPNYGRWAVAANINATASSVTADEYMVSVKIAQGSNPSAAPTWGGATQGTGNMWITNAGDIFIYA